jgi:hypothetical protein
MPGAAQHVRCNRVRLKGPTRSVIPAGQRYGGDALPVACFLVTLDIADLASGGMAAHDGLILWS